MKKVTESLTKNGDSDEKNHLSPPKLTIQIVANYPTLKKLNKRKEWFERGSFHVRIKEWDIELRGINYCVCREKVWILMPSRLGKVNDKECYFPIINFRNSSRQRYFVKLLQHCFTGFMKGRYYKSYEVLKREERSKNINNSMVFVTPPSRTTKR